MLLVATRRRAVIGCVAVSSCDLETHRHLRPWLASLYVLPAARGKGLAEGLIMAAVDWASARRERDLYLYAVHGRLTRRYARLGWLPLDRFRCGRTDFEVMRRPLSLAAHAGRVSGVR